MSTLPLLPPPGPVKRSRSAYFLPLLAVGTILGFLVTGLNLLATLATYPTATLLGVMFALAPLAALLGFYYWMSQASLIPRNKLAWAFAWGALGSTGYALLTNAVVEALAGRFATIALSAPIGEELFKAVFLFLVFWLARRHWGGMVDALVYAGLVGAGFAFIENILYFTAAISGDSISGTAASQSPGVDLAATFFLRALISPFAHPLFTTCTAIGIALALRSSDRLLRWIWPTLGLAAAIVLHMAWNGAAVFPSEYVFLVGYFLFFVPLFIGYIVFSLRQRTRARRAHSEALADLALRGSLPPEDIPWISSPARRKEALLYALRWGGPPGRHLMDAYLQYSDRLAHIHSRVLAGETDPALRLEASAIFHRLQEVRGWIAFPPTPLFGPPPVGLPHSE